MDIIGRHKSTRNRLINLSKKINEEGWIVNNTFELTLIKMNTEYNFRPTLIEKKYLREYCEQAVKSYYASSNSCEEEWEFEPPFEAMMNFFYNEYGYDIHGAMKEEKNEPEEDYLLMELLNRKQEQAHMMIKFSTDLESRTNKQD